MRFSTNDIRRVGAVMAEAARTEIMPRFRNLLPAQVRQKTTSFDLVTEADEAAEAAISAGLMAAFPGAVVIGEEGTHADPSLLDRIADADLAFIVDPIDGTRNFAAGLPLFGVMVAVTIAGEAVASAILDPICGDWAYAARGEGAWIEQEDGSTLALQVAEPVPLELIEAFISTTYLPEPLRTSVSGRVSRLATTTSLRCAAHEYRTAAAGHCHVLMYNRLMPWDHVPGWLLHHEAGGYSAHFDGTPYHPAHFSGGLICAPDAESWSAVREALLG
jgi:fructose-1,6-bisphosphatase/inositol monophosphatase family enzyme